MNESAKKALLQKIPHGVYVVTTGTGASAHGFTATWLTQVSFEPPLIAIGVRRDSKAYTTVTESKQLVVNFLAKDGRGIAERFFKPPAVDGSSFGDVPFHAGPATGGPVLDAALGFAECRVTNVQDGGDHAIVVAQVVEAGVLKEGAALILADTPWKYGG